MRAHRIPRPVRNVCIGVAVIAATLGAIWCTTWAVQASAGFVPWWLRVAVVAAGVGFMCRIAPPHRR